MSLLLLAAATIAGVPGVTIRTYPIWGGDVAAIQAALDADGPSDRNDGRRVAAITHWRFTWRWPGTVEGPCDLASADVRFAATVTLPRLVGRGRLPANVGAAWSRYRAALEAHEDNHVRYAYDHRDEVLAAIRGATCATAGAAAQVVVDALVAHDLAYDRDTDHGAAEGATFP